MLCDKKHGLTVGSPLSAVLAKYYMPYLKQKLFEIRDLLINNMLF